MTRKVETYWPVNYTGYSTRLEIMPQEKSFLFHQILWPHTTLMNEF